MVPGWVAFSISTGVPFGSEPESQPLVSVAPPVPEQCAAWPTYTLFAASWNTKFDVHCAPSVMVSLPGWIVALPTGAQSGCAKLGAAPASATQAITATATVSRRSCIPISPLPWVYVLRFRDLPVSGRDQSRQALVAR